LLSNRVNVPMAWGSTNGSTCIRMMPVTLHIGSIQKNVLASPAQPRRALDDVMT
jgi:hypothetical protein